MKDMAYRKALSSALLFIVIVLICSCSTLRHVFRIYDIRTPEEACLVYEIKDVVSKYSAQKDSIQNIYIRINGNDPSPVILKRIQPCFSLPLKPVSMSKNEPDKNAIYPRYTIKDIKSGKRGVVVTLSYEKTINDTIYYWTQQYAGPRQADDKRYKVFKSDKKWMVQLIEVGLYL